MNLNQNNEEQMIEFKIFSNHDNLKEKNKELIEKYYILKKKML